MNKVHAKEAEIARNILSDYRAINGGGIIISGRRADRLEQAICEALVDAGERK
jgi:hypothetical protein